MGNPREFFLQLQEQRTSNVFRASFSGMVFCCAMTNRAFDHTQGAQNVTLSLRVRSCVLLALAISTEILADHESDILRILFEYQS